MKSRRTLILYEESTLISDIAGPWISTGIPFKVFIHDDCAGSVVQGNTSQFRE